MHKLGFSTKRFQSDSLRHGIMLVYDRSRHACARRYHVEKKQSKNTSKTFRFSFANRVRTRLSTLLPTPPNPALLFPIGIFTQLYVRAAYMYSCRNIFPRTHVYARRHTPYTYGVYAGVRTKCRIGDRNV